MTNTSNDTPDTRLAPGATIGILGGGQLGRMTALAAANLGYRCHVYDPSPNGPCAQVAAEETVASWTDKAALARFAASVDVITYEFENVPIACVEFLEDLVPVRPGADALRVAQHRIEEKRFARHCGMETAEFWGVTDIDTLVDAVSAIGTSTILKTTTLGYDGKGQIRIDMDSSLSYVWDELGSDEAILEQVVPFTMEVSVIVARALDGTTACFPIARNEHSDGILRTSTAPANADPADLPEAVVKRALEGAERMAAEIGLVGLLAVEMFVTPDNRVLVNEMAPRPHNSGHWTMDGCATSQFEQLVRAICGLPLGSTEALFETRMVNLIGDDVDAWPDLIAEPGAKLHLYGKGESRPGRKMGHVNRRLRPL
jgi:5-(carboxyamino)imidazole ribonucleotide synthase